MFLSFSLSLSQSFSISLNLSLFLSLSFLSSSILLIDTHTIIIVDHCRQHQRRNLPRFSPIPNIFHFFPPFSFFLLSPLMRIYYVRSRVSVLCVYVFPSLRSTLSNAFSNARDPSRSTSRIMGNGKKKKKKKRKKRKRKERAIERAL